MQAIFTVWQNSKKGFISRSRAVRIDNIKGLSFTVTDQNEIIYTFLKDNDDKSFFMHIITTDGKQKHEVQVPVTIVHLSVINVLFNHVNKTVLVNLDSNFNGASLFIFSKAGELLYDFEIQGWRHHKLTSSQRTYRYG